MAVVVNQLEQVNQFSGLGEPNAAYLGQTFTVPASPTPSAPLSRIEFKLDWTSGPDQVDFRVLLTTVTVSGGNVNPGTVLFESTPLAAFPDMDTTHTTFGVNLPNVPLTPGQQYAFILDAFADRNGLGAQASAALSNFGTIDYPGGISFFYNAPVFPAPVGTRATHFADNWTELTGIDLSFRLVFGPDAMNDSAATVEDTQLVIFRPPTSSPTTLTNQARSTASLGPSAARSDLAGPMSYSRRRSTSLARARFHTLYKTILGSPIRRP